MKGKLGALMLVLLVISYFLHQQFGPGNKVKTETGVITVTGQITDRENGKVINKATLQIQGTPTKVSTDDKGEYSVPAKKGDQLLISHPKYRRMVIEITDETQDIQLVPKESELKDKLKEDFPDMQIVE